MCVCAYVDIFCNNADIYSHIVIICIEAPISNKRERQRDRERERDMNKSDKTNRKISL